MIEDGSGGLVATVAAEGAGSMAEGSGCCSGLNYCECCFCCWRRRSAAAAEDDDDDGCEKSDWRAEDLGY